MCFLSFKVFITDILDKCNLDEDWHPYAGRCYRYFTENLKWSDAREICSENSGTLAILDSNEKQDVFKEIVSCKDYDTGVWIGLSDVVSLNLVVKYLLHMYIFQERYIVAILP